MFWPCTLQPPTDSQKVDVIILRSYSLTLPILEFAIVDIETTGSHYGADCITEIGIVITDGTKIIDSYESFNAHYERL